MRKWIIGGAIAAALVVGSSVAAIAATNTHDPNVNGGRFCVDYGTNVAHYDWEGLPCGANQYLDQTTYSEPTVTAPTVVDETQQTKLTTCSTYNNCVTLPLPSGMSLDSLVSVTDETTGDDLVFTPTFVETTGDVAYVELSFTGTSPGSNDTLSIVYTVEK